MMTRVDVDAELLAEFESAVDDETFAVLKIVDGAVDCTAYDVCTVIDCPEFMLPSEHGNDVHGVPDKNVVPVGGLSLNCTLLATPGPLFVTTIV